MRVRKFSRYKIAIIGLFGFLAACAWNPANCPVGCTNGTNMIYLAPEALVTKEIAQFVVLHELGHIVLGHKPWTPRKEVEANEYAEGILGYRWP